jgi:hypothetical protein
MLQSLLLDVRYAARALRLSPAATAVAVLTLALGIGVNTAVFTVFESIVLRPLPFGNADRLVHVQQSNAAGVGGVSAWVAAEWQARGHAVQSIGLYADGQWVMTTDGDAEVFRGRTAAARPHAHGRRRRSTPQGGRRPHLRSVDVALRRGSGRHRTLRHLERRTLSHRWRAAGGVPPGAHDECR